MLCNFIFYLSESVKQVTAHDVISLWLAGAINILTYNFLVNTITNIASIVYKLLFLWSLVSCCETSLVCFYQCGFITFVLGSCLSNHTGKKLSYEPNTTYTLWISFIYPLRLKLSLISFHNNLNNFR